MKRTVLVSEACSGLGEAITLQFAKNGFSVAALVRDKSKSSHRFENLDIHTFEMQLENFEESQCCVKEVLNFYGNIDIIINCSNVAIFDPLEATQSIEITEMYKRNVLGPLEVIKAIIPHFKRKKRGCIVSVTGLSGVISTPFMAAYTGSKWALEGISEGLNYELNPFGIQVKIVEPGKMSSGTEPRKMRLEPLSEIVKSYQAEMNKAKKPYFINKESETTLNDVAKTVFNAATQQSDKVRYVIGDDAKAFVEAKQTKRGEDFIKFMQNGLKLNK